MSAEPDGWRPDTYLAFGTERLRPAVDLLSRVPLTAPARVVDLGCGPGNTARLLRVRFPQARIEAVDTSPAMLATAALACPDAHLIEADIATWRPHGARPDLIFSNAALHWIRQHDTLLPRLLGDLAPGGVLAIQMPANFEAPSHETIRALCAEATWHGLVGHLAPGHPVAPASHYARLLSPRCQELSLWETTYWQRLTGETPVLDWLRGSTLTRLVAALPEDRRHAFLTALGTRLTAAYPAEADGTTLFPFRRLFMIAQT